MTQLVLYSTKQSLKHREVSFLAIVEIIVSISIYWYIALYFNTYIHIILSIIIAPIFLLISEKSRKYNINLLNKWSKISNTNIKPEQRGLMMLLTQIISLILTIFLVNININFILTFFIISIIATSILLLFFGKEVERIRLLQRNYVSMSVGMILGFLIMGCWYSAILVFIVAVIVAQGERFFESSYLISAMILLNPVNLMIASVVATYSFAIYSIIKTKKHYYLIIDNWKFNLFMIDLNIYPELILGIEETNIDILKFSNFIKRKNIFLLPLFIFPILYRISIKSTAWFYLPLLFIVQKPNLDSSIQIGKFLSELYQTLWAWIRGFLALGTIVSFIVTYFNYYSFTEVTNIPFISLVSMLYLDFSSIEVWKVFQLLVAVLTIGLFLYANAVRVPAVENNIPLKNDYRIMTIYYLNSLRNWISLFYFTSAFIFLAYYFKVWEYPYIPYFMEDLLSNLVQYIQYKPFG